MKSDCLIRSHRDLIVWQKSMLLVNYVYRMTDDFPRTEIYGLTSQMRRAAISISSNIAEGRARGSRKDYRRFLIQAFGSAAELDCQIQIADNLKFGQTEDLNMLRSLVDEVMRMLRKMIATLSE